MKKPAPLVHVIHNPGAGQQKHSEKKLSSAIERHGFSIDYASSEKRSLKDIRPETSFIAIAGGDGTIKKTIIKLLDKKLRYKRPVALLPFGTANNIATSLGISEDLDRNIASWSNYNLRKFDIGQVTGTTEPLFFIESFGFGIFPKLMQKLEGMDTTAIKTAKDEFEIALDTLLAITETYAAHTCSIEVEDKKIRKKCIMVEIMNISRLGPNLRLSEHADPSDGFFDVVIVEENQREILKNYIAEIAKGKDVVFPIPPIRTKHLKIKWDGKDAHVDDQLLNDIKKSRLKVNLMHSLVEIMVEGEKLK